MTVNVGVQVGVTVGVQVGVCVGVAVKVGVAVGVGGGPTWMLPVVPVMELSRVSVAVMVQSPWVFSVAVKLRTPASDSRKV